MERLVKTRQDYQHALAIIARLMDHAEEQGGALKSYWEVLVREVIAYEEEHWPVMTVSAADAAAFRREQEHLGGEEERQEDRQELWGQIRDYFREGDSGASGRKEEE